MVKRILVLIFSKFIKRCTYKWACNPLKNQDKTFQFLIKKAKYTAFGRDHNFEKIKTYEDFKNFVPIRDYEDFKVYIDRIMDGASDILWKGFPIYFSKTSGTTSGMKYIPITKDSMPTHIKSARDILLLYIAEKRQSHLIDGKMIFLQGSPKLEDVKNIKTGRLSGIVAHHIPRYLQKNRLPSWETNCIENWEQKIDAIVEETKDENMTVIAGIPSWVKMYFERLREKTGKKISELFPNFNFFIYGGINFEPYKKSFEDLIGKEIDYVELYVASEGFIAYRDSQKENGMLLQLNNGIFYEFIPADKFYDKSPPRFSIKEVSLNINYAIILNTSAGLWGYNIGDTVEFTSLNPYRIKVTGRVKHFISAFGEHVIGKEVEKSLSNAILKTSIIVNEFTVAPKVNSKNGSSYHEWFIEFKHPPDDLTEFAKEIDKSMQKQNIYYNDLIKGKILKPLVISSVKKGGFYNYMKSIGKLGGQNKIPQLSNDRKIADELEKFKINSFYQPQ